jgi:mannose-6-phosphate isomerase-like protein (cupin superfamily)
MGTTTVTLDGVICEACRDRHEDGRRLLTAVFNGDFTARQVKVLEVKADAVLGEHYHDYDEMFYLLKGQAVIEVENVETKDRGGYQLSAGDRIFFPKKVAHRLWVKADSVLIGCTDQPYLEAGGHHAYHLYQV